MAKATSPTSSATPPVSFESALSELETIVKSLEAGQNGLALEESLTAYQRGMTLLRYCQDALATAEQKVQILEKDVLRDFAPASEE